jgi:hypothetical protein
VNRADDPLRGRFEALSGPADADWRDVRRRARRRTGKVVAAAAALLVALVAAGLAVGGEVIGIFDVHGKQIPLNSLSPNEQEFLVTSMCPHPELRADPGTSPKAVCREGAPSIEEIADDGSQVHYRIRYPWGLTCVGSGPVRSQHDASLGTRITNLGCNAGAPGHKLVPTPERPITVDASLGSRARNPHVRLLRLSGLAGRGVVSVGLVRKIGRPLKVPVRDNAYAFGAIPDLPWIAVAAYDRNGRRVYREALPVIGRVAPRLKSPPTKSSVWSPGPPKRPSGAPLEHAETPEAVADVYRNGVVLLRFKSTSSQAFRRLVRSSRASSDTADVGCLKVAFSGGRWNSLGGGSNAHAAQTMGARIGSSPIGGMPSGPFDVCEISGTYGRYWNDEEGTHELVEVPFTAIGRRFLDERATGRDLAYLLRTKKMMAIRRAIHRGEPAPSADELARIFGPRVVPLASRGAVAPVGKVGVWTDGRLIVASELTPAGRRLYVTARDVFIGANNIRGLSLTF